jgi:itaconyl-CoA hydratase
MVLKRADAQPTAERPAGWPEEVGTQPEDLR